MTHSKQVKQNLLLKKRHASISFKLRPKIKEALDGVLCSYVPGQFEFCVPCPSKGFWVPCRLKEKAKKVKQGIGGKVRLTVVYDDLSGFPWTLDFLLFNT